jgi:hypothetical protein
MADATGVDYFELRRDSRSKGARRDLTRRLRLLTM